MWAFTNVHSQEKITVQEANALTLQARQVVISSFPSILNFIADSSFDDDAIGAIERESYSNSGRHYVYDEKVSIEDDTDPQSGPDNKKDVDILKYYKELNTLYEKKYGSSIEFDNFSFSSVKKNADFIYILVKFDSHFKNRSVSTHAEYPVKTRVALVRLEKHGERWAAFIGAIKFYSPLTVMESSENNLTVVVDTSYNAKIVSALEFNRQRDSILFVRNEEDRRNQQAFDKLVAQGDSALNENHFKEAKEDYENALDKKQSEVSLNKKIQLANRLIKENSYENLKIKGDKAQGERRYEAAIELYQRALNDKSDDPLKLQPEIEKLNKHLIIINPALNKLKAGSFETTIEECEKILKEHKTEKSEFPELYYIEGVAYSQNIIFDPHSKAKALEKFNTAINNWQNYVDAHIALAEFYIKYQADYKDAIPNAISSYDVLIRDSPDDSPDKPRLIIKKANLEDMVGNYTDAISDYNKAIALRKIDSFYYEKGELLYRMQHYAEAKGSLDMAIKLNPNYNLAYYYRGLNYVELKKNYLAGVDFISLEKLGIQKAQTQMIDSLSKNFFNKGNDYFYNRDYANADSAYKDALRLREQNFSALHGQAQIRFVKAEGLYAKSKLEDSKILYQESIELNKKAISYNPSFSDAQYIEGLAQMRIKEYDEAIESFNAAIRSSGLNTMAYIEKGNTLQIQEKHNAAIESYKQAVSLLISELEEAKKGNDKIFITNKSNQLSKTYQLMGLSQYYIKDYNNAMASLNLAIDKDKTNSEALFYRGLTFEAINDLSRAIDDYDDAIKYSKNFRYYYADGKANFKRKRYEQSIDDFNYAMQFDSLGVVKNGNYLRGKSYLKLKNYIKATVDFTEYEKYEGAKKDSSFYTDRGFAELYSNHDAQAVTYFNQTLDMAPNYPMALFGLGCAQAKAHNYDKAFTDIQKAFATHKIIRDDIKQHEEMFLEGLKDDKAYHDKYKELKKSLND